MHPARQQNRGCKYRMTQFFFDRLCLASQDMLVDGRHPSHHAAVGGDHFPRMHCHDIPRLQRVEGTPNLCTVADHIHKIRVDFEDIDQLFLAGIRCKEGQLFSDSVDEHAEVASPKIASGNHSPHDHQIQHVDVDIPTRQVTQAQQTNGNRQHCQKNSTQPIKNRHPQGTQRGKKQGTCCHQKKLLCLCLAFGQFGICRQGCLPCFEPLTG